jgi:iron complex outermembrane receptor protein
MDCFEEFSMSASSQTLPVKMRQLAHAVLTVCLSFPLVATAAVTEEDYLAQLPVVSTVTRLPQPLMDAPGAVTLLTREMIRQSGARDLVDLLRWVPGMYITGWSGAHRVAAYHASLDEYGTRMQVFVDGRSVYSTFYVGGASTALTTIPLEDVERVEVLRGANSAAYGTNALFGVINVITRHADDTLGMRAAIASGGNGVSDTFVSGGFRVGAGSVRISAMTLEDDGFLNKTDSRRIGQVNLRTDVDLEAHGQLTLTAGAQDLHSSDGSPTKPDDPVRPTGEKGGHLALTWKTAISESNELLVTADYTDEQFDNRYRVDIGDGLYIDADQGGNSTRGNIEFQQIFTTSPQWRWVWGGGVRRETLQAALYFDRPQVVFDRLQLFGSGEWRPTPNWVLNVGGMLESRSQIGKEFAPRLAANYHISPTQTLRAASSHAFRMPTLFESFANTWVRESTTGTPLWREYYQQTPPNAERVDANEIGYLHQWPIQHILLDARIYSEHVSDLIYPVVNLAKPPNDSSSTLIGGGSLDIRGLEYQVQWQWRAGSELRLSQTFQHPHASTGQYFANNAPDRIDSLSVIHRFDNGVEFSLLYSSLAAVSSRDWAKRAQIPATERLDLRLGRRFQIGASKVEAALTWVAAAHEVLIYNADARTAVPKHLVATLRLEL